MEHEHFVKNVAIVGIMDGISYAPLSPSYAARAELWSSQDAVESLMKLPGTMISTFLEQMLGWVALYYDEPVAVVTISVDERHTGFIRIAVKPAFQRHGIGNNLLQYALDQPEAKALAPLQAIVDLNNTAGQKVLGHAGFSRVGYTPGGQLKFVQH